MVAFSWLGPLDSAANDQVDASLKRALASYATARALNAVISFAQGTEVSFQPLGVGLNLAPGQILDPLNDLVEKLSDLLLIASVTLGVQRILLAMGASWVISLGFTAIAVAWCALLLLRQPSPSWLTKALLVLLMLRFAIPVALVGTDMLFRYFLESEYHSSQAVIDATANELDKAPVLLAGSTTQPDGTAKKPSLLTRWFSKQDAETNQEATKQEANESLQAPASEPNAAPQNNGEKPGFFEKLNPKQRFESFKQAAEKAVTHAIQLMVIFTLDTIVLPIFLIWALISIGRGTLLTPGETTKTTLGN